MQCLNAMGIFIAVICAKWGVPRSYDRRLTHVKLDKVHDTIRRAAQLKFTSIVRTETHGIVDSCSGLDIFAVPGLNHCGFDWAVEFYFNRHRHDF